MKGFQDKKKLDLQAPFPGCLGRMINLFDLSNGVVAPKMLTEKALRDGRDQTNAVKMSIDRFTGHARREEIQKDGELRRNSSNKRSNGTPVKMLMEQEMWNEGVHKEEPPNVVARLMGLSGLTVQQSDLISGRQSGKEYKSDGAVGHNRSCRRQKECNCLQDQLAQMRQPCAHGSKVDQDGWNNLHEQPSKITNSKYKRPDKEFSYEKRMSLVRQKFAEAKRLATDEKLLHSKEFQEALQFLSSNKDLFLKFLDEPNSLIPKNLHELQPVTPPSDIKQITILKPSESIKTRGNALMGKQLYSDGDESEGNGIRRYRSRSISPTKSLVSEPTRIVVLKPGLGNPHDTKIMGSPISSTAGGSEVDSVLGVDEAAGSRRLAKEITRQMRTRLKSKQNEGDMSSSVYSNYYIGDESFNKSESVDIKEVSGELSDLEFGTPTSGHSWDFISRSGSPYSASCPSQTRHLRESSVVREAKKRILERWAMVSSSSTACSQEEGEARRSTSTLGEMLTIPEVKKEQEEVGEITLESSTCQQDAEEPVLCLPRSRSVPVSSSAYEGIELNGGTGSAGLQDVDKEKNRKSSSFRGRVSSLFFPRTKKLMREKSNPPGAYNDRLQRGSAATLGTVDDGLSQFALDSQSEKNSGRNLTANSFHAHDTSNSLAKDISSLASLGASGIFGETQDQPSPVSVLDGPFLYENHNSLLQSSEGSCIGSHQTLSRSPLIGSVSRSLSWEDLQIEATSPNSLRLSRLFLKADEDQNSLVFIQKLVRSAGLERDNCSKIYTGWHSLASPLSPQLVEKLLDHRGEGVELRERQSKERLLFDSVNEALVEISRAAILAVYPWSRSRSWERRECQIDSGNAVSDEIWHVIRNWSAFDKCFPGDYNDRSFGLDTMLKREVSWATSATAMWFEMFDLNNEVCTMMLKDLVEEALMDLTGCSEVPPAH